MIAGYLKYLKDDLWNILLLWEYFLGSLIVDSVGIKHYHDI